MYDAIVDIAPKDTNYVLTNALLDKDAEDLEIYKGVQNMAERRGSHFLPVRLLCNEFQNRERIVAPERETRLKQTTFHGLAERHKGQVLVPDHPHTMTIDISDSPAPVTAAKILKQAALICE